MSDQQGRQALGALLTKLGSGATPRGGKHVYKNAGVAFIRSQNVYDNRFDSTGLAYIDDAAAQVLGAVEVQEGDVLLNITGESVARCCLAPADQLPARVSQHVMIVRPDSRYLNSRFLQSCLVESSMKRNLQAVAAAGATRPALTKSDVARLVIPVPPMAHQNFVANVLGVLDDKIECNRRLAHLADELWMGELTQALDGWDDNGPLPLGWSRPPLSSLARFVNGRNFTKGATGTGRMIIRIAELNSGPGGSTVYNEIDALPDHVARPGDLLFAWSGSLTVQRWWRAEAIVNQHIFKVLPLSDVPMWLIHGYLLKLLPWYRQIAADKATTMGHIQRYQLDEPVSFPDAATRNELNERCAPLWQRSLAAERESLVLVQLRDILLPPLLSGELRDRDAEAAVEEVA